MAAFNLTTTPTSLTLKPGESGAIVVVVSNRLGRPFLARVDPKVTPAAAAAWVVPPAVTQRPFEADPAASYNFEFGLRVPGDAAAQAIQFRADVVDPQLPDDPLAQGETVGISVVASETVVVKPEPLKIPWWVWVIAGVVVLGAGFGIFMLVRSSGGKDLPIVALDSERLGCLLHPQCGAADASVLDSLRFARVPFTLPGAPGQGFLRVSTLPGFPGAPAAGFHVYSFALELGRLTGGTQCITSIVVPAGKIADQVDLAGDGTSGERVFSDAGGGGGRRPATARRTGTSVRFEFDPAVCAGQRATNFGFISDRKPTPISATLGHGEDELKLDLPLQPPRNR